jgi:hypothetical protein
MMAPPMPPFALVSTMVPFGDVVVAMMVVYSAEAIDIFEFLLMERNWSDLNNTKRLYQRPFLDTNCLDFSILCWSP